MRQQRNGIARCKVLARLLIVLLVETTKQLLKHRSHPNIGHGRKHNTIGIFHLLVRQIDTRIRNLFNNGQKSIVIRQFTRFAVVLEVFQHIAHILTEAVEIFYKIVIKDIVIVRSLRFQPVERPFAGIEIAQPRDVFQHAFVKVVQSTFLDFLFHSLLGGLK